VTSTLQTDTHSAGLSLRKNFTWTFAGNAVYAASQWGILVLLAKLSSPEMVGQFALGLAITAPVILFANLQLRSVQATDARHEYRFADYLGLRLLTTLLAYGVIVGIVVLSGYRGETALVVMLIGLAKSFEAVSDVIFGLLQQHERMDRIAKSLMIEGPLTLAVMGIILYLTGSIVWAAAGMAAVWGLQLALYDFRSAFLILRAQSPGSEWHLIRPRVDFHSLRHLSWLALPLGFVAMLISLNANIPRYFVESFLGKEKLGIFAALAYVMVAQNVLMNALGQSAMARLSKHYVNHERPAFIGLVIKLIGIGAIVSMLVILAALIVGREFLTLLYGAEYAEQLQVFIWLMIAAGLANIVSFLNYAITSARQFRLQLPLAGIAVTTTTLICLWLVPSYGLFGVVISTTISLTLQACISLAAIIIILGREYNGKIWQGLR
jgi:O-antigen/teichoic acid export membrane protein